MFAWYLNGAIIQWNRLALDMNRALKFWDANSRVPRHMADAFNRRNSALAYLDLHFYLICWDKMDKLIQRFLDGESDEEIVRIHGRIDVHLRNAVDARNHQEHLDRVLTEPGSYGILFGYTNGDLVITHEAKRVGGSKYQKGILLGHREIIQVARAYEEIVRYLKSNPSLHMGEC
jgi:hypothetical protein